MPSTSRQRDGQLELLGDYAPEQFEQLYMGSRARVYNLAARVVGDPEDAADITQEVFLRAYLHPPRKGGWKAADPWLYRVTVNACYDHLRRAKRHSATSLEEAGEIAERRDDLATSETTRVIESALGALSVRYRTALLLRDLCGLEAGEVGAVLGVSAATARVLLHRARGAFRRAVDEAAPQASTSVSALGLAAFLPDLPLPAGLSLPALGVALAGAAPSASLPLPVAGVLAKLSGFLSVKAATVLVTAAVVASGGLIALQTIPAGSQQPDPGSVKPSIGTVSDIAPDAGRQSSPQDAEKARRMERSSDLARASGAQALEGSVSGGSGGQGQSTQGQSRVAAEASGQRAEVHAAGDVAGIAAGISSAGSALAANAVRVSGQEPAADTRTARSNSLR